MQQPFFEIQMGRLISTYGKNVYTAERIKLLWDVVRDVPNDAFKRWVDKKILESVKAPLGVDFREFAKNVEKVNFKNTLNQSKETIDKISRGETDFKSFRYKCSKCRDDGALLATKLSDGTNWVFVCDCPQGEASHWAEEKKVKDGSPFKIRRWKYVSDTEKQEYKFGGI